jgi:hypothetical protein
MAGDAHQVSMDHADVIFGRVAADIGADRQQPLCDRARAVHRRLVHHRHRLSTWPQMANPRSAFRRSAFRW